MDTDIKRFYDKIKNIKVIKSDVFQDFGQDWWSLLCSLSFPNDNWLNICLLPTLVLNTLGMSLEIRNCSFIADCQQV